MGLQIEGSEGVHFLAIASLQSLSSEGGQGLSYALEVISLALQKSFAPGIKNICYFWFFYVEERAKCIEKCTFGSGGVNPA